MHTSPILLAASFEATTAFASRSNQGTSVKQEIEPVDDSRKAPLEEHLEFLEEMGRRKGCEPESEGEQHEESPWEPLDEFKHFVVPGAAWIRKPARARPPPFGRWDAPRSILTSFGSISLES